MGYKIKSKSFSLSELQKLSIPGRSVPSFFWLIPLGNWDQKKIKVLWDFFNEEESICRDIGLMIVKDNSDNTINVTDFSVLTAKLSDILPAGVAEMHEDNNSSIDQALILSAAFPQPGWGVLISLKKEKELEKLITLSLEELSGDLYGVFTNAINIYQRWEQHKRNAPKSPDLEFFFSRKKFYEELINILSDLKNEAENNIINESYYQKFLKELNGNDFEIPEELSSLKEHISNEFILAILIKRTFNKLNDADIINKRLNEFIKNPDPQFFKEEKDKDIIRCAKLLSKLDYQTKPVNDFVTWADEIYNANVINVNTLVENALRDIKIRKINLIEEKENLVSGFKNERTRWLKKERDLHGGLRRKLELAIKYQIEQGPVFLQEVERCSKSLGIESMPVSWDPPRMIGWKILSYGIELTNVDFKVSMEKEIPGHSITDNTDNVVDGSLFTDYVHYYSKENINLTTREATKRLLSNLLRPGDILKVKKDIETKDIEQMVEELITHLGWPLKSKMTERKLAECINVDGEKLSINSDLIGKENDIRIIIESYCKDLIYTLSANLGYEEHEFWEMMDIHEPKYRKNTKGVSWYSEIQKLTIGNAIVILKVLLEKAYPDKANISLQLIETLTRLRDNLNALSHHNTKKFSPDNLAYDIHNVLEYTKQIISEMPWHFSPVQRTGELPVVLTGDGWSHSYKENRQLSIIVWSTEKNNQEMLIWNPSKINPVIPDGIIIKTK